MAGTTSVASRRLFFLLAGSSGSGTTLGSLGTVATAGLFAVGDTESIENAADDLVSHTWKVANTATANEDDGVFLEVVPFTGNVGGDFFSIGEPNTGHLSECRVWFFGSHRFDLQTNATFLRTALENGGFGFG